MVATKAPTQRAERAVRNYLTALNNPEQLADPERVQKIERRMERTSDWLRRSMLLNDLNKAACPRASEYEDEFVAYAKEWADYHGVSADHFRNEGVGERVLRRAGLVESPTKQRREPRGQLKWNVVRERALAGEPYTINELAERAEVSRTYATRVTEHLLLTGELEELDEDPRGRTGARRVFRAVQ